MYLCVCVVPGLLSYLYDEDKAYARFCFLPGSFDVSSLFDRLGRKQDEKLRVEYKCLRGTGQTLR